MQMRSPVAAVVALLAICPVTFARGSHDWTNVQKLKRGAKIVITFWAENPVQGRFESATVDYLRITVGDARRGAAVRQIAREKIWTVTHIKGPRLGDPDAWLRNGAMIGGAIGLTVGIVRDARGEPGGGANWLLDGAAGAGLGFFGGCVGALGTGTVALFRHDKLIYMDVRPVSSFPELNSLVTRRSP
jgi:hypothetical protein